MIISTRNPFAFIVLLFCAGALSLFLGAIALWEQVDYYLNGKAAVMVIADPKVKQYILNGGVVHSADVRYVASDGELAVPGKYIDDVTAKQLAAGAQVPITYLKSNPKRVYFQFEEPKNPWGWLTASLVLFATFAFALKLRRREITSQNLKS